MNKLIVTSVKPDAGKTSVSVGLASVLKDTVGYMKPLGDRLLYRKKRLWDHDSALMADLFNLTGDPQLINLGFDHAKLRYMYNAETTQAKLREAAVVFGEGKDLLLIESGRDLGYGLSVFLDAVSIAEQLEGRLVVVLGSDEETVLDEVLFVQRYLQQSKVELAGIIFNKVADVANFEATHLPHIVDAGVPVLGTIPLQADLMTFSMTFLVDRLLARTLTGETGLDRVAKNILVGAMSVDAVLRNPVLNQEDILMITSGDRTDMILAALDSNIIGMILTNNIIPPANVIAKAVARQVPLLVVPGDTYQVAKQIDDLIPLLTRQDMEKVALLHRLVETQVKLDLLLGG